MQFTISQNLSQCMVQIHPKIGNIPADLDLTRLFSNTVQLFTQSMCIASLECLMLCSVIIAMTDRQTSLQSKTGKMASGLAVTLAKILSPCTSLMTAYHPVVSRSNKIGFVIFKLCRKLSSTQKHTSNTAGNHLSQRLHHNRSLPNQIFV